MLLCEPLLFVSMRRRTDVGRVVGAPMFFTVAWTSCRITPLCDTEGLKCTEPLTNVKLGWVLDVDELTTDDAALEEDDDAPPATVKTSVSQLSERLDSAIWPLAGFAVLAQTSRECVPAYSVSKFSPEYHDTSAVPL